MNTLTTYLRESLGVDTTVILLEKQLINKLPLYITSTYMVMETMIMNRRICLLFPNTSETGTPDQLAKHMVIVEQKTILPTVFVFEHIASYNLKRYMQKGINFIVPKKQLFIPALMMDIRKVADTPKKQVKLATPMAQFILLYHLQKEELNGFTIKRLAEKFRYPYLAVNRAVNNLNELNLCSLIGGKEKNLDFSKDKENLWAKALPLLQNPIQKTVYTDQQLAALPISGINALSHYTMLNDENKRYYAISKDGFKNLDIETDKQFGDNSIEIWKYDPLLLSFDGVVDKLSLYLIYKDDADERIQGELETLISEMKW